MFLGKIILLARNPREIESVLRYGTVSARVQAVSEIGPGDFDLWEIAIQDISPEVRLAAIKIAQQFPSENVLPIIVRYLNEQENNPREVVAEVEKYLRRQKFRPGDIDLLKELALNNPDIAAKILPVIITIAPEKVTDLFLQRFISGNDFVRLALASSLKSLNREYVRKVLGDYLDDELPEIRLAAARSLIEMGAGMYLPKIVRLLNENRQEIASAAEEILRNCPRTAENAVFWAQALSPNLVVSGKILVIEAIAECKNPGVIPVLWNYLFDQNPQVQEKSYQAILQLADDNWRMYFVEKLFSKRQREREIAVAYLSQRRDFSFCLFALRALAKENVLELREKLAEIAVNNAEQPFPEISEMLFSANPEVRRTILKIIAHLKAEMYLEELLKYQRQEKNLELQKELLTTLGAIGTPRAVEVINNFLMSKNPEIVHQAIAVIEKIGNYTSLNNLLLLLNSKNEEIASASRQVLDKLIDENSFPYVWTLTVGGMIPPVSQIYVLQKARKFVKFILEKEIKSFLNSPNGEIILEALELARLKAEVSPASRKELVSEIISLLSRRDEDIRQNAAKFLENFGDEEIAQKVFFQVAEEKNDSTRQSLLRLLVRFPHQDYFPVMLKIFSLEDGLSRQLALEVLLSSPRQEYSEIIISRLNDSEPTVRMLAAEYLGRLRFSPAIKQLIDFVRQESSSFALVKGLWALGEIGVAGVNRKEVLDIGMEKLASNNTLVQQAAAEMLDKLITVQDSDFLVRGLNSSNRNVCGYALRKVGEFKLTTMMEYLRSLLAVRKSEPAQQLEILNTMEKILDRSNIAILEKMYPESNKNVRLWILTQIKNFPTVAESKRIILKGLREDDSELRLRALESSVNITDDEIIRQQLKYLAEKDVAEPVRKQAATILKSYPPR